MLTLVGSSNCDRYKLKFITILSVRTHTHTHTRIYLWSNCDENLEREVVRVKYFVTDI